MGRRTTSLIVATLTLAVLVASACRDATAPVQDEPVPLSPPSHILDPLTGNIAVKTTTTGSNLDAGGYTVTVDLLSSKWIATNGSVTFTVLTGAHTVVLSGVASNCTVSGGNTRVVTVLLGGTVSANFNISCAATGPTTGNLTVSAPTTGPSPDPDGYTVTLNGSNSRPIGPGGSTTYNGLSPGNYSVALNGMASNCTVNGSNPAPPRTVTVTAGNTASTSFSVSCGATTGNLTVSAATSGPSPDPDGYTVTVNGGNSRSIGPGGSTTYTFSPGNYSVALNGMAANCTVNGSNPAPPRTVTVTAGNTASTTFSVSCAATPAPPPPPPSPPPSPPPGGARITGVGAIGAGPATPGSDRKTFNFEATDAPGGRLRFSDFSIVRPGGSVSTVTADRAADAATGITSFSRTSTACVTFGGTGRVDTGELVSFSIDACDNGSPGVGRDVFTMSVSAAAYRVSGTLTEGDITVSGGGGGGPPPPPPTGARVTGRGAMGPGTATPGSDRQVFDFEATSAPGGRVAVTDYSVVRANGSVGRMSVDRAADPGTGVTSFTRTSAACVRFEGMSRLDTGELMRFFIDACDNASPGAGFDTFTVTLPDRPFTRSGTLREGDIAITSSTS